MKQGTMILRTALLAATPRIEAFYLRMSVFRSLHLIREKTFPAGIVEACDPQPYKLTPKPAGSAGRGSLLQGRFLKVEGLGFGV